jgi:hypothetical protein
MLVGLGGLAIVLTQRGEQAGLGARHGFEPTAWIVGFAALLLSGVLSFLRPLGRPRSSLTARSLLLLGAITLPVLYALAAPVHSSSAAEALLPKSLACLGLGIALAVPFIALLWLVDRADRMTAWRIALLSVTGGLLSNLGLALHCAVDEPLHLLVGHAPLALALALALFVLRAVRSFRTTAN